MGEINRINSHEGEEEQTGEKKKKVEVEEGIVRQEGWVET